jgi:hypothetical protein
VMSRPVPTASASNRLGRATGAGLTFDISQPYLTQPLGRQIRGDGAATSGCPRGVG